MLCLDGATSPDRNADFVVATTRHRTDEAAERPRWRPHWRRARADDREQGEPGRRNTDDPSARTSNRTHDQPPRRARQPGNSANGPMNV